MKKCVVALIGIAVILSVAFILRNRDTLPETRKEPSVTTSTTSATSTTTAYTKKPQATTTKDKYSSLTNADKKEICEYMFERYDYYDALYGGYSGDKYSDTVFQEAADKYGLTVEQISIIWMN